MNKGAIIAVLGVGLVLGGVGLLGGLGDNTGNTPDAGQVQADGAVQFDQSKPDIPFGQTKADNVRLAYKLGDCPGITPPRLASGKADKDVLRCVATNQHDGFCSCFTQQQRGDVTDEMQSAEELPPGKRKKGLICCSKNPGVDVDEIRYVAYTAAVPAGCHVFVEGINAGHGGLQGVETSADESIRTLGACDPCPIPGSGDWGECPYCICAPGGCAAKCSGM